MTDEEKAALMLVLTPAEAFALGLRPSRISALQQLERAFKAGLRPDAVGAKHGSPLPQCCSCIPNPDATDNAKVIQHERLLRLAKGMLTAWETWLAAQRDPR